MALRDTLEAILREYDSAKPEAARRYCHTRVSTQLPSKPRPPGEHGDEKYAALCNFGVASAPHLRCGCSPWPRNWAIIAQRLGASANRSLFRIRTATAGGWRR